jgi:hypothetical protein
MEILINDSRTIEEIQEEFSTEYPYLKIEFLTASAKNRSSASSKSEIIPKHKKMLSLKEKKAEGKISMSGSRTVREILDELEEKYGLHAQIFRKFGKMWIETGLTDHWSLSLQNSEGHEISETFIKK